jgi:hypothetical protein
MATNVNLESFESQNGTWDGTEKADNLNLAELFLASFLGLKHLKLVTLNLWEPSLDEMLANHSDLESCDLRETTSSCVRRSSSTGER